MADFYTVRQAAQPQQNRPNPGGRIPPPPPMPARQQINPQGGGGIPPPPPMMPQGQQGPPPPAMHQIPPQVRQRPLVEISDIRRERRTEADYRDDLTEYFVYRFEKVLTEDGYDSDGDKIKATWENCLRTRVTDISKKVAAREIQNLNKYSDSLADKKKSLNPAQQRQLEKALQELSSQDNDERFEFTLVQIDHQLKPVDKPEKKSKKKDVSGKKRSRDNKKKYQRISITAYYKRAPLPTINAQQLVRDIQLAAQQAAQQAQQRAFLLHQQQQQQQQHMAAQQAQHQAQHQAQQQQQQQPRVYPMNNQNGRHPGQGQGRHPQDRRDPRYHGGSASSDHSSWSDDESGSEGSTVITEPSRSSRDSYERRRRSRKYIEESPKHYGINNGPTRRHTKDGDENRIYVVSGSPPAPEPPRPPRMIAPAENLERIKRNAYEEGRADQRDDDLRAEIEAARYQPRIAPRPAIVQRPNLIRHVTSSEVDRQLYDDEYRLANLSVNDPRRSVELLYPDEIDDIRREEARRRRAAEARFRMEEEESLILEQEAILRERAAQDYMRRRETSPPNPFAPLRRHYYD